jgi:hypothetical protein
MTPLGNTLRALALLHLPTGTRVVARVPDLDRQGKVRASGSVGAVVGTNADCYRVRFPDDREATYSRSDLIVRVRAQRAPALSGQDAVGDHLKADDPTCVPRESNTLHGLQIVKRNAEIVTISKPQS